MSRSYATSLHRDRTFMSRRNGDLFDSRHIYGQSMGKRQMANICTCSLLPQRSKRLIFVKYTDGWKPAEYVNNCLTSATIYNLLYFCKLLYMFRVVNPPIIRSTYNCNHSIWHWSNHLCYLPLSRKVAEFHLVPDSK
jgi:hypothetical protein